MGEADIPAKRIAAAADLMDKSIEKIAIVNEVGRAGRSYLTVQNSPKSLLDILNKCKLQYGLITSHSRPEGVDIAIYCDESIKVTFLPIVIEYIISTFIDNMYKYSIRETRCNIHVRQNENGLIRIEFSNQSNTPAPPESIYGKGIKIEAKSQGFGYGLYWAKVLEQQYNHELEKARDITLAESERLDIWNDQVLLKINNRYNQKFIVNNIR